MKENILVIDGKLISKIKFNNNFTTLLNDILYLKFDCGKWAHFVERDLAEKDETIKQIIPYIVLKRNNKYLAYQRTPKGGENRLHNKWSVGFGGHINPCDFSSRGFTRTLELAVLRELQEELYWGPDTEILDLLIEDTKEYGIIYDDTNPVGRVHIGLVYILNLDEIPEEYPEIKENCISNLTWISNNKELELEGWSDIFFKIIEE